VKKRLVTEFSLVSVFHHLREKTKRDVRKKIGEFSQVSLSLSLFLQGSSLIIPSSKNKKGMLKNIGELIRFLADKM
jgi:hypothetical protein